jgi:AcrR family transcriptional regulator
MGRRTDHSREDLREMILSTAEAIIGELGAPGLTARRVADRIGYSAGTLYNLFKDLDELIVHINARTLDALYGVCVRIPTRSTPEETLQAYARAYLRFTEKYERRWAMLLSNRSPPLPELPEWYQLKVSRLLSLVEAALGPLFRDDQGSEQKRAARVLWASIHGISSLAGIRGVAGKSTLLTNDLITNYVSGLRNWRKKNAV